MSRAIKKFINKKMATTYSFILSCACDEFYEGMIYDLPYFLQNYKEITQYSILCEKNEKDIMKRNTLLYKKNIMDYIPSVLVRYIPPPFLESILYQKEENTFYREEKRIEWKAFQDNKITSIYFIKGDTYCEKTENPQECKITLRFDFSFNKELDIQNRWARFFIFRVFEKRVPHFIYLELKKIYTEFAVHLENKKKNIEE